MKREFINIKNSFNGYLMSGDSKVLKVKNNIIIKLMNKNKLPLHFRFREKIIDTSIENWLHTRYIDTSRRNFDKISKVLGLSSNDLDNIINFKAFSITDNYWLKKDEEDVSYEELIELSKGNYISDVALNGDDIKFQQINITPELTNIGSFEKCWHYENEVWYLKKKGDIMGCGSNISEVIAYEIAKLVGIKCARYEIVEGGRYVICESIAKTSNLEPWGTISEELDDDYILEFLSDVDKEKYLDMIYLDALIRNIDRHEFNFALETNRNTGEFLGLSKIYDNNLSLVGVEQVSGIKTGLAVTKMNAKILKVYGVKYKKVDIKSLENIIKEICNSLSVEEQYKLEDKLMLDKFDLESYILTQVIKSDEALRKILG
ncbi:hypothetical protein [uncultured Clostridium sp.]|uniref:hypothetical protein n=1 Tax=uncultured Clostridium sp. TaxID=59620 RepID=UPI0026048ED2|nr:hypothetical protein [uncultured Clostridium sp.]